MGEEVAGDSTGRFGGWQAPEIKDGFLTQWNWLVIGVDGLDLGRETDIGAFSLINARHGVTIEEKVQIGSHCSIYSQSTIDDKTGPVALRKNCRIGSHSVIMPNVTVGENSIVGACSFVNRDIPPNVVAFGCPAKVVRQLSE